MKLEPHIPRLDDKGLRHFGITLSVAFALVVGLFLPLLFGFDFPWWPWLVAVILTGLALARPRALDPVYRIWMMFGFVMNAIMSRIVLGLVFYAAVLPTGLLMRALGKRPLDGGPERRATSYRKPSSEKPAQHMQRPF